MGLAYSFINESYPPESKFTAEDIPYLGGKIAIVTGANSGVGRETAKALLNRDAKVYFAARNKEKVETAILELKEETGREGIFLPLDLADLHSVKRAAQEYQSKETELHMLFNNGGAWTPPIEEVTAQGYDLQFGTNVLGHFYLTKLLLPTLLETARSSPDGKARVINTSSLMSRFASAPDFNTFKDSAERRAMGTSDLYNQSKLGNIIISNEFARRYGDQGLVSVAVNPGNLGSGSKAHKSYIKEALVALILSNPFSLGALTQLWAGTTEEGASMNGKYLIPWARYGEPTPIALDETLGKDLWVWLEEQVASI
ncbi:hypothetical protein DFP72DRAFT_1041624 [Ephemerocybe angulata]|uniref:NAD(P)-binding protein n=1 Tax=Ephemerocybe angulata TaxID=980116 RepID=A0A8H6MEL5_9AGAR|nr:hypothetical protein DFP72DRAFT_1041624 [Tulosesus angulatus]